MEMIGHICYINNDYLTKYRIIGITEIEKVILKNLKTDEVKEVMMFRVNRIFKRGKKGGF